MMARRKRSTTLKRIEAVAQGAADSLGEAEREENYQINRGVASAGSREQVLCAGVTLDGITLLASKLGYDCRCKLSERHSTLRKCKCTKMKRLPPLKEGGLV